MAKYVRNRVNAVLCLLLVPCSSLLGCSGEDGAEGVDGQPGPPGAPGVAGPAGESKGTGVETTAANLVVTPTEGALERPVTVLVTDVTRSVDFTKAASAPVVRFGPDVSVSSVTVVGPHSISAKVTPTRNAVTGFRAVTVEIPIAGAGAGGSVGVQKLETTNGFLVRSPLSTTIVSGTPTPGGRVTFRITNHDTIPFDSASVRVLSGFGDAYIDASMGPLTKTSAGVVEFTALIDPLAPAGGLSAVLGNFSFGLTGQFGNPVPEATFYGDPKDVLVAPRAPKVVTAGTPITGETSAAALDTQLYKISPPAGGMVSLSITPTGAQAQPGYVLTTRAGKGRELLKFESFGSAPVGALTTTLIPADSSTGDLYLAVGDALGRGGPAATYGWTVTTTSHPSKGVAEQETTHGAGSPQVISNTNNEGVVISGAIRIPDPPESDVYQIELGAPKALEVSFVRKNIIGAVELSTTANFAAGTVTTVPLSGSALLTSATTGGTQAQTWYVRVNGTTDWDLSSYVVAVRPL